MNFALASTQVPSLDLEAGAIWLKGFALLCLMVVLVYLTGKSMLSHGSRGDTSKSFSVVAATMICLIPLGLLGGTAILTGYGSALLGVITKVLS